MDGRNDPKDHKKIVYKSNITYIYDLLFISYEVLKTYLRQYKGFKM